MFDYHASFLRFFIPLDNGFKKNHKLAGCKEEKGQGIVCFCILKKGLFFSAIWCGKNQITLIFLFENSMVI